MDNRFILHNKALERYEGYGHLKMLVININLLTLIIRKKWSKYISY